MAGLRSVRARCWSEDMEGFRSWAVCPYIVKATVCRAPRRQSFCRDSYKGGRIAAPRAGRQRAICQHTACSRAACSHAARCTRPASVHPAHVLLARGLLAAGPVGGSACTHPAGDSPACAPPAACQRTIRWRPDLPAPCPRTYGDKFAPAGVDRFKCRVPGTMERMNSGSLLPACAAETSPASARRTRRHQGYERA